MMELVIGYILGGFLLLLGLVWWRLIENIRKRESAYASDVEHYQGGEFCAYIECPMNRLRRNGDKRSCQGICRAYRFHEYLDREGFSITRPRNRERKSKKEPY